MIRTTLTALVVIFVFATAHAQRGDWQDEPLTNPEWEPLPPSANPPNRPWVLVLKKADGEQVADRFPTEDECLTAKSLIERFSASLPDTLRAMHGVLSIERAEQL